MRSDCDPHDPIFLSLYLKYSRNFVRNKLKKYIILFNKDSKYSLWIIRTTNLGPTGLIHRPSRPRLSAITGDPANEPPAFTQARTTTNLHQWSSRNVCQPLPDDTRQFPLTFLSPDSQDSCDLRQFISGEGGKAQKFPLPEVQKRLLFGRFNGIGKRERGAADQPSGTPNAINGRESFLPTNHQAALISTGCYVPRPSMPPSEFKGECIWSL